MVLSLVPVSIPCLAQNSEGKCLWLNLSRTPTMWLESGRQDNDSNLPSLLLSLASKVLYILVVLLITTSFSSLSFLWKTRLDWVSYCSSTVCSNLCFLYWNVHCSFRVNCLGACQYPHWDATSSGTRASSVFLIMASPASRPVPGMW